ncbi:MAG: sensor histidine kinase [Gemmatimonadetes bacterium]|nr:sensor histidine kinase [Gemmatimonadota bacterium]
MTTRLWSMELRGEHDVVLARQRARQAALLVGYDAQGATRIATAVSEIVRNAFTYAGGGEVEISAEGRGAAPSLFIRVADRGPGIPHLAEVLGGRYRSSTGMGVGITGTRRLMDSFDIQAGAGTTVVMSKRLPPGAAPTDEALARAAHTLANESSHDAAAEVRRQNQELLRVLAALEERQDELARLNAELEETNRGVLALHAELRDRADREAAARQSAEAASRARDAVLAIVSHDLRNPVGSVITAASFLLDTLAAEVLSTPQGQQVGVIHRAARRANRLLDDLMDVTRIEAGGLAVEVEPVEVAALLADAVELMRGPAAEQDVELVGMHPGPLPPVLADRDRVLQVFANLAGNAVKFTPAGGTVTLAAALEEGAVAFSVADTGPGMSADQVERAFDRFWQAARSDRRGVGLGLSIARGIVEAHGGSLSVASAPGAGTTFRFTLPLSAP